MWWFNTNLPIHVAYMCRRLGVKKSDPEFWESPTMTPMQYWTKTDFDAWKIRAVPAWLDELTSCPGCLSMHISFYCALFITCAMPRDPYSVLFFFLAWGGWPYIGNYLLKKLNTK